ncbi:MAG: NAD(P)/FAD-dependent oxidoreductase [Anaerolineae bacterium]
MSELTADVVIVGGGPAGLAAGISASREGANALILERNPELGGVLMQCIHPGFGLKLYGEELTGPEYAVRWLDALGSLRYLTDTMVLSIEPGLCVRASSAQRGIFTVQARSVVLAMGCRERTRGAIALPGTRPAGVMTAGTAQRLVNLHGYMPGRHFVVLGSGDIGMIMARRLTWEGAEVSGVYELMPYLSGLRRNYVQCLLDYDIPLHLSHTVTDIRGARRLESVAVAPVDDSLRPLLDRSSDVGADTLLLSVGLIPENELTRTLGATIDAATAGPVVDSRMETSVPGVFAAGNVVHVYDLVDDVSLAGEVAGREAAHYALSGGWVAEDRLAVRAGENVRSLAPQFVRREDARRGGFELQLRVRQPVEAPSAVVLMAICGGVEREVTKMRLKYVRPGEMVTLAVDAKHAAAIDQGSLRLDVVSV